MKVLISDISIKERVRKDIGDLALLKESMQKHGQLNPITVTRDNELIAGHRRLLAATELGWAHIDASIVDRDSHIEKLQLELEENVHRKDFSPEELLAGYRRLERLLKPRLTRRIGNFFSNFFGKLFRRRKRRNANLIRPAWGPTAAPPPAINASDNRSDADSPNVKPATDDMQYGV